MNSISREQARAILAFEPPRYLFRRFNILRLITPGETFLEIGAGNMLLTQELARRYRSGVVIEYGTKTQHLYECLRETHFPNIQLIIGQFEDVHLDSVFDLIVACEVLEHVEDDRAFLAKMYGLLKPGGQIILSFPAGMKYWSVHDEIVGHFRRYEQPQVDALMRECRIKTYQILSYGYPFINWFRYLRVSKAKRDQKSRAALSKKTQTEISGFTDIPWHYGITQYLVNRYTMWLPALFSTVFNHLDWSEGYIVVIQK